MKTGSALRKEAWTKNRKTVMKNARGRTVTIKSLSHLTLTIMNLHPLCSEQ